MRSQILFVLTIGAALVVPAVAIHIGGFLAYLVTVAAFLGAWWQVAKHQRRATIQAIREAISDPQPHQAAPAPSASAQD